VALSADPDPRRAGLLAAAEAATMCGRDRVRTVIVFAAGTHARAVVRVAEGAREHLPNATVVVVGGSGVVSPEGESVGPAAVSALALTVSCSVASGRSQRSAEDARELGERLGRSIRADRPRPMLLFVQPAPFTAELASAFERTANAQVVLGGGLAPDGGVALCPPGGGAQEGGSLLAIRIDGGVKLASGSSAGVSRLTELQNVEAIDRGYVTRLGGRPPLEVLTQSVEGRKDRPLVLGLVAPRGYEPDRSEERRLEGFVRGIGGVNPKTGAVHLGDAISVGDRVAFTTLDPRAAREDFGAMLREIERGLFGGVPVAGIFIDCAGRGSRLYGHKGVDARAIATRFPEVPFAGIRSSFELAPFAGATRVLSYSGVLGILYAPS
jgi:small ligand-binding sensory domain FIST